MHILPYTLEYQYINKCSDVNTSVNGQNVAGRKQIQICFLELSGFFFFFLDMQLVESVNAEPVNVFLHL